MRLCFAVLATLALFGSGCSGGGNVVTVTISPATTHIPVGGAARLQAQARDGKGPVTTTFKWGSDKGTVASVDANGQVSGLSDGLANITATAPNGVKGSAVVQVGTGGGNVLTLTTTGSGMGRVTSSPSGIDCGATCAWGFAAGTMVTLTATAASGSYFRGWSGACSGTGPCTVTMDADQEATAEFDLGAGPMLTVAVSGSGTGTIASSPAGVSCKSGATSGCSSVFPSGTQVTLSATAATGIFLGWSGGGCGGTDTCVMTLTADTQVTASFAKTRTLTVMLAGDGSGSVTSSPSGISCKSGSATGCSFDFPDTVAMVSLSESPSAGSSWAGWSVSGGGAPGCSAGATTCPFVPGMTAVAAFSSWSVRQPFPSSLGGVASIGLGGGTLIAVGGEGKFVTAPAATPTSWTAGATPVSVTLRGVVNLVTGGGELAVAVGDGGTILTSSNGTTWTAASSPTTNNLHAITNDTFNAANELVAVGDAGTILRSSDGTNWTKVSVAGVTQNLNHVDNAGGTLGAVGDGGTLLTSSDHGATWSVQASGTTQPLNGVSLANGKFIAVGNGATLVQATDAGFTKWAVSTPAAANGQDLEAAVFFNGSFVVSSNATDAMGALQFLTAMPADLSTWTAVSSKATREHFGLAGGLFAAGDAGSLLASSDASNWVYRVPPRGSSTTQANTTLSGLAAGGGLFVSVGNFGAVVTSSDGMTWTARRAATANDVNAAVAFGNNTFVAAGSSPASASRILVSSDGGGAVWSATTSGSFPTGELVAIIYSGAAKGFVAVGYKAGAGTIDPLVVTSTSGAVGAWTIQPGTGLSGAINSVAFDGTAFVVTGGTSLYTSSDAITWTANGTAAGMGDTLGAVASGGGIFVVLDVTHPEVTLTSSDHGASWTRHASAQALHNQAVSNGLAFGNGVFLTNTLAQSANGIDWTLGALPVGADVQGAVYAGGWVTSGAFETFLKHP